MTGNMWLDIAIAALGAILGVLTGRATKRN